MTGAKRSWRAAGLNGRWGVFPMVLNQQNRVALSLPGVRDFVRRLRATLRLGRQNFNVCFVGDREIARLNRAFRGRPEPTDVLSFPWAAQRFLLPRAAGELRVRAAREDRKHAARDGEFKNFLGDVVISVDSARRNALAEGHSTANEIRWLILHGLLHLAGYNHETDKGEMTALELSLRERLAIQGRGIRGRRKRPRRTRPTHG